MKMSLVASQIRKLTFGLEQTFIRRRTGECRLCLRNGVCSIAFTHNRICVSHWLPEDRYNSRGRTLFDGDAGSVSVEVKVGLGAALFELAIFNDRLSPYTIVGRSNVPARAGAHCSLRSISSTRSTKRGS